MIKRHDDAEQAFNAALHGIKLGDGGAASRGGGGRTSLRAFHDRLASRLKRR